MWWIGLLAMTALVMGTLLCVSLAFAEWQREIQASDAWNEHDQAGGRDWINTLSQEQLGDLERRGVIKVQRDEIKPEIQAALDDLLRDVPLPPAGINSR